MNRLKNWQGLEPIDIRRLEEVCHHVDWNLLLIVLTKTPWSGRRHLLPSAVPLRTQRATFTALGSSLHEGIV
ncbi:hypothetical protein [Vibrio mediterranei]|uniref:hypothetical protein n=1 Tax=Vibrio mediterranei TaxID=689 RepID=UPI000A5EE357|nr:hypothetical protein [Vibrio mediterranei]